MRKIIDNQLTFGAVDISKIEFNLKSRDDIPKILKGLQYMYTKKEVREKLFQVLEQKIAPKVNKKNGRPGMDLWKILVTGTLRLNLNWDYDRLHEMVNHHNTIRKMLGHGLLSDNTEYNLQTLKDNIKLLTPEILNEINTIVVNAGHGIVKKKDSSRLKSRCDSFVVETNVHYPTDIKLLFDATRKAVQLTARLCKANEIPGWRQSEYNVRQIKRQVFKLQKLKHSTSKKPNKKEEKKEEIKAAYGRYVDTTESFIEKVEESMKELLKRGVKQPLLESIEYFVGHAKKQMNQIIRRVVNGEKIPHEEKVFSVFEPHTEWICKGKAGVPVELGLRVALVEDEFKFIINHTVMQNQTDDQIAIPLIETTKKIFPNLYSCSFDKGFHSPLNQKKLKNILDVVALPKKGKLSKKDKKHQKSEEYLTAKKKHSAVESAINALEVHGLDRCPDIGIDGFKRYVGLAVLARNIQSVGAILVEKEQRKLRRDREKCKKAA